MAVEGGVLPEPGTVGQCSAEVPVYRALLLSFFRISQPWPMRMLMTATAGIVHEAVRGPALLLTASTVSPQEKIGGLLRPASSRWWGQRPFPKGAKVAESRPKHGVMHALTRVNTAESNQRCSYCSSSHFRFVPILPTYMIAKWRNISILILRRSCVAMQFPILVLTLAVGQAKVLPNTFPNCPL